TRGGLDGATVAELADEEGAENPAPPSARDRLAAANQPRHAACLPVYPRRPALTILRVPLDRLPHAFLAGELGRPAGQLVELAEVDAELLDFTLTEARAPLGVGLELLLAPVAELLAGAHDQVVPVEDRDGLAVAVHVDVARRPEERRVDVPAHAVLDEAEVALGAHVAELHHVAPQRLRDDRAGDEARALPGPVVVEHPRDDRGHP